MPFNYTISSLTGLPVDQIRLILTSMLCIPLSYMILKIGKTSLRILYSVFVGTLIQIYVYSEYPGQLAILYLMSLVVYFIVKYKRRNCGKIVTFGSMLVLSTMHIYRLITDYGSWKVDVTTILMMVVCKYSSFAYAC
jgi:hypothetical protein